MSETVVIDAGPMGGGVSGTGRYAFKMLDALLNMEPDLQFKILLPPDNEHTWETSGWGDQENVELVPADITGAGPKRQLYYLRNSLDYSVYHSLSSYVPVFLNGSGTNLVTVHDLKHVKIPGLFDRFSRIKRAYVTKMIARSVREADYIITVSEHTKSDLIDHYGIPGSDISVVPLGPGDVRPDINGEPPVSPPYLLFVGMVLRHKNVSVLVEAFNECRRQTDSDVDLVIAGSPSEEYLDELMEAIDPAYRESVHFLGYVPDDTLARLYKHATAFVFPSLYEGFGIPPLEAMGYGTPVIASDRASIPEVVGDAGEYFDAADSSELADVLAYVLSSDSRRAELAEAGYKRFNEFTWNRTARETLEIYQEYV